MSMELREKLKDAKRKKEIAEIKNAIISETNSSAECIVLTELSYQEIVDLVYDELTLILDEHNFSTQFICFENFLSKVHKDEYLIVCIRTKENIFYINIPAKVIKDNPELFWNSGKLMGDSRERIVINNERSKGIVMLDGEYGIEKYVWA